VHLNIEVDIDDLAVLLLNNRGHAIRDFIIELDNGVADTSFTKNLIYSLFYNLGPELSSDEMSEFVGELVREFNETGSESL
jgi:hypothetical protein